MLPTVKAEQSKTAAPVPRCLLNMCVHNPFCSQTGDVLLCFFAVENFKSPQRQPRDSEKHLLTEVDLLFTDLLSHRHNLFMMRMAPQSCYFDSESLLL